MNRERYPRRNSRVALTLSGVAGSVVLAALLLIFLFTGPLNTANRPPNGITPSLSATSTSPVPPGTVQPSKSGPYGFSVLRFFTPQTVTYFKDLGVTWVRYQLPWRVIEANPGQFDWHLLDAAVALANASAIHITFPIQDGAAWATTQVCTGLESHALPNPNLMAQFASIVAKRYNGQNGHGFIDSFEIGNEEFDNTWTGSFTSSTPCRQPNYYIPVLKAVYPAIKAQSPHALVGMFGLWWTNTAHIRSFMQGLYQSGTGKYFDFANFHYYICNDDPALSVGGRPSFDLEWQTMYDVMAHYGDARKPVWVTEVGWATNTVEQSAQCVVSPRTQAKYLNYVLAQAASSHVIQHIFWYTIDRGVGGMSITQNGQGLPSFYAFQAFVRQKPEWT